MVGTIVRYVFYGLVVVFLTYFLYKLFNIKAGELNMEAKKEVYAPITDNGIIQSYLYTIVGVIAAFVLALLGFIYKPKSIIPVALGLLVVIGLFYMFRSGASTELSQKFIDMKVKTLTAQSAEAGIKVSIVLMAIAILLAIGSGLKSVFESLTK